MTQSERADVSDLYGPTMLLLDLALIGCVAMLAVRYWQRYKGHSEPRG